MQIDYYYNKIKSFSCINDAIYEFIQACFESHPEFTISRQIQWIHVHNKTSNAPAQGWKIHVSATYISAINVLREVSKVVLDEKLEFKVADTLETLKVMNDAHYPRGYSGKFITIYPNSDEQFVRVIEKIHQRTYNLKGPRILSDKQYKDGIVFYRYGGFKGIKTDSTDNKYYIYDLDNNLVEDQRNAWYSTPPWVSDPLEHVSRNFESRDNVLFPRQPLKLLYSVRQANKGGVYIAQNNNDEKIVLKEARKYVSTDKNGDDVSDYLKNEYNILMRLQHTNYVPKVIDFLETTNSSYLIEEYIEGDVLSKFIGDIHRVYDANTHIQKLLMLSIQIIEIVKDIHKHGIVIRDLSKNNIIITQERFVKVIDFDIAFDYNDRLYAPMSGTEGYYFKNRNCDIAIEADDIYSIGCILFYIFSGRDPLFMLEGTSVYKRQCEYLTIISHSKHIPKDIVDAVLYLLNPENYNKITLSEILTLLQKVRAVTEECCCFSVEKHLAGEFNRFVNDIALYLSSEMDFTKDNIFPTSDNGKKMSPTCLQTGSSGVGVLLIELNKLGLFSEDKFQKVVEWTLSNYYHSYNETNDTVNDLSLYFGISGVLWFLFDAAYHLHDTQLSTKVQELFLLHIRPSQDYYDIVLGNAGYGMTALHFYQKTNNKQFLHVAKEMGNCICKNLTNHKELNSWTLNGEVYYGFAHGYAGICHFLNVLYLATKNTIYINTANEICEQLISKAIIKNGCASWEFGPNNNNRWSHWCNGSSGIGSALVRMYATTNNKLYLDFAEMAACDVFNNIWNSSICQCHGACGDAEFLYDMYCFTQKTIYLSHLKCINEYISFSKVIKNNLYLFYDETKMKVSCDWGTGLSGAGTYFIRLRNREKRRLFMNDEFLFS